MHPALREKWEAVLDWALILWLCLVELVWQVREWIGFGDE